MTFTQDTKLITNVLNTIFVIIKYETLLLFELYPFFSLGIFVLLLTLLSELVISKKCRSSFKGNLRKFYPK